MSSRMIQDQGLTIWVGWDNFGKRFWIYAIDSTDAIILDLGLVKSDVNEIKTPSDVENILLERLNVKLTDEFVHNLKEDMVIEDEMRNNESGTKTVQLFGFWD